MFDDILEKLFKVSEQLPEAPSAPPREKPVPTRAPVRPIRKPKPSTPIRPKPYQVPEPKGFKLGKDVELFKQRRKPYIREETPSLIHPEKVEWMKTGDPELNTLFPTLSGKERSYLELIVSDHYNDLISRIENYTGLEAEDLEIPQLTSLMMQALEKVVNIESKNKKKLEKLAIDLVLGLEEFKIVREAVKNGEVRFDVFLRKPKIKLLPSKELKGGLSHEEQINLDLASELKGVDSARLKQRLANLLIQGGAVLKSFSFPLVNKELRRIDPDLPELYGILSVVTHLGYFLTPFGIEKPTVQAGMVGGAEEVVPEDDKYVIRAEGLAFPFLVHEIVKGIYDWISIDPRFAKLKRRGIERETEDILVGPGVFRTLQTLVPTNKQYLLPLVQKKFLDLDPSEVREVLIKSEEGASIIRNLVWDSEEEWGEYLKTKREATEESILEGRKSVLYHQYVEQGKVSKELFNKFVDKDPSREKCKYLPWMLKQYTLFPGRDTHIIDVVTLFDKQVSRGKIKGEASDIYKYDLEGADKIASEVEVEKTRSELEKEVKEKESEKVAETDRYLVVVPKSHKASCFYGAHTKWCISAKTSNYWDDYWGRGCKIYVVIDKETGKKYAVAVERDGTKKVYDEEDKEISFKVLKRELGIK